MFFSEQVDVDNSTINLNPAFDKDRGLRGFNYSVELPAFQSSVTISTMMYVSPGARFAIPMSLLIRQLHRTESEYNHGK